MTLIRCLFHPHVTAVACKRPQSFLQKCRWQVTPKHAYTLYSAKLECADYAAVQAQCGNLSGNELTHNLSGNTQPQSSQLASEKIATSYSCCCSIFCFQCIFFFFLLRILKCVECSFRKPSSSCCAWCVMRRTVEHASGNWDVPC